jgi:hypothetical protein
MLMNLWLRYENLSNLRMMHDGIWDTIVKSLKINSPCASVLSLIMWSTHKCCTVEDQYTDSDYPFDIFKLFRHVKWKIVLIGKDSNIRNNCIGNMSNYLILIYLHHTKCREQLRTSRRNIHNDNSLQVYTCM